MAVLIPEPAVAGWPRSEHPAERISLSLIQGAETTRRIPLTSTSSGRDLVLEGRAHGLLARMRWREAAASSGLAFGVDLAIVCLTAPAEPVALELRLPLDPQPGLRWMIPGLFYDRPAAGSAVSYPRIGRPAQKDPLLSQRWMVRADRASHPLVMAMSERESIAITVCAPGDVAIGLDADPGAPALLLGLPAFEWPVRYADQGVAEDQDGPALLRAGQIVALSFGVRILDGGPHAYDTVLREMYARTAPGHPLHPWLRVDAAAELAAYGLVRWHFDERTSVLYETAAFDRDRSDHDRREMHVAWLSGAPSAHALLAYGRDRGIADYVRAGVAVLDRIATGLAPCGAFWDRWTTSGWRTGWNRDPRLLHARTTAEATLFLNRALDDERSRGIDHPSWEAALTSNLSHALLTQRRDGAFGSYIDAGTGAVAEWRGAAGLLWIAALLEGRHLVDEGVAVEAAARAGEYYARFLDDEQVYGAPEDLHLAPSSEDGYNAVMAYLALFEATGSRGWLELASHAADWTMTFRFARNLDFPDGAMLHTYDFRTRGADLASPVNQHLHAYGLICLPEMVRLWQATGDAYYLDRTRDNLACFLQFVARHDGDFGARQGMISERYHHTDWSMRRGDLLPLSHAWCAGLLLYASHWAMRNPGVLSLPAATPPD